MIDLSNIDFNARETIKNCTSLIKKESTSDIEVLWLGLQDYNSIFSLQKEIQVCRKTQPHQKAHERSLQTE